MSVWKRFVRAIKSMFGGLVSGIEDPKLILEQNIRERLEKSVVENEISPTECGKAKDRVRNFLGDCGRD